MIYDEIRKYVPVNEQEERDKAVILSFLEKNDDAFLRENLTAHMTASAWIVNETFDKTLLIYHNIYGSWAWTGGHADGEKDLLSVALREAKEETGIEHIRPHTGDIFSVEIITVDGHEKRGAYVPSHLHMNVTYLLIADEKDILRIKEDENSGVKWFSADDVKTASTEEWMINRVYDKLITKVKAMG